MVALICPSLAGAEPIRIATWNLFNLHHVEGEPLRPSAPARTPDDYQVLRRYVDRLDAHIVALQEVNGPKAARKVFPEGEYQLFFSGRYLDDVATGRESDRIYTGFAVRRGVFDAVSKRDYEALSVLTRESGRPTRWGTDLLAEKDGKRLRLLSVHLKSSCHEGELVAPSDDACDTLGRQREPLEAWIDARAGEDIPFIVLGDFNRRFDVRGAEDHLWGEIDDGFPNGLNLWRLPFGRESDCWRDTPNHYPQPIDFLVFDQRSWARVDRGSFRELDYDEADRDADRRLPSDHCPLVVEIDL